MPSQLSLNIKADKKQLKMEVEPVDTVESSFL